MDGNECGLEYAQAHTPTVFSSELKHVICRVPASGYVTGHHTQFEVERFKDLVPSGKDNGGGVFHGQ